MDFSAISSVRQYAKGAALKTQWNLKKQSGDVTAHSKTPGDFLSAPQREDDSEKLQRITDKVSVGAKLTEKEMDYLRQKNPQLYEKLRQIEKEQKAYEEALRRCRSKDEAQRLHMAHVGEAMQAAKSGDGTAAYRMNRMSESMTAFSETGEYKKLSTEAEQALARRAEQAEPEASAAERDGATEERHGAAEAGRDAEAREKPETAEEGAVAREPGAAQNERRESKPPEPPAAADRFGAEAYQSQRDAEAREERRRRALDAEA